MKNDNNILDKFVLVLGDETLIWSGSCLFQTPLVSYRALVIEVTYLCNTICEFASQYFNKNKERFEFKISVLTQEEFTNPDPRIKASTAIAEVLNDKLEKSGSDICIYRVKNRICTELRPHHFRTKTALLSGTEPHNYGISV